MTKSMSRRRLNVPRDDAVMEAFLARQADPSASLRVLAHAFVSEHGNVDVLSCLGEGVLPHDLAAVPDAAAIASSRQTARRAAAPQPVAKAVQSQPQAQAAPAPKPEARPRPEPAAKAPVEPRPRPKPVPTPAPRSAPKPAAAQPATAGGLSEAEMIRRMMGSA